MSVFVSPRWAYRWYNIKCNNKETEAQADCVDFLYSTEESKETPISECSFILAAGLAVQIVISSSFLFSSFIAKPSLLNEACIWD